MKCCSWSDALCSGNEHSLFIGPPVDGWVIIFGDGLPDFREDIDAFYKFLMHISAAVGHVQFFCIDGILHHHAWVRLEAGRVIRAYAWAGQVLWIQGRHTPLEAELGLHCWDYDERAPLEMSETAAANVERIPRLAACWSFDPGLVDRVALNRQPGIAGGCSFPRWH